MNVGVDHQRMLLIVGENGEGPRMELEAMWSSPGRPRSRKPRSSSLLR